MTDEIQDGDTNEPTGKAKGGKARADKMTPEQRRESALKAAAAKKELASLPVAEYGSAETPLRIGDVEIQCYVLDDGSRVLSQRGMAAGIGMSTTATERLLNFVGGDRIKPFINNDVLPLIENPIKFRHRSGGGIAFGYPATILADICDAILAARKEGKLQKQQEHLAERAELLVRGFARVGIVALIDEATGYQRDREKNALAKILEEFVAKELKPWVSTFPADYYEGLFKIYGLEYPPAGNKSWRPSFIGNVTNNVVYSRLAPELLPELKKAATKAERKAKLHQWLTEDIGHPKLREHLASIVTLLKISKTPEQFYELVDEVHPKFEVNDDK
ncbi:P63C domain-containing protein [Pantoea agglomerans]|uniref:P63C domain-containing protein n=1 Tax=Enterobacter agglomerans TaxID=549 RepID=UPI00177B5A24|nr:P63C domain-containing protein [Pantoea agglomerans]MBD8260471.1 P63C domain-containing protein [Pantoea agglomerans]